MRNSYRLNFALALGAAGILCAAFVPRGSAQATRAGGDFIIRCFFNGNVAEMDPILDPGSTTTDEPHVFFGNMIQGTASFPTIKSGDGGLTGTMEHNGLSNPTNCQDTMDTAGYWQPEPYLNGSPWLPGGGCSTGRSWWPGIPMGATSSPACPRLMGATGLLIRSIPASCATPAVPTTKSAS
jgi:hypothetical protein